MKEAVIAEFLQHATDELRHADMGAGRIIQLGGTPVTEPKHWYDVTSCTRRSIRRDNSQTEYRRRALRHRLLQETPGSDPGQRSGHLQHRAANPAGRGGARGRSPVAR